MIGGDYLSFENDNLNDNPNGTSNQISFADREQSLTELDPLDPISAKNQLINELISMYHQDRLPKLKHKKKSIEALFNTYEKTNNKEELFNALIDLCKDLLKDASLKNRPKAYFFVRSMANYKANIGKWPLINSPKKLIIAQQKFEAIQYFKKEKKRFAAMNSDDLAVQAKYDANQQLIDAINNSDEETKLSVLLASAMKERVKRKNKNGKSDSTYSLRGMPCVNIQEALFYNRDNHFRQAISVKNFKKFCDDLIDPDKVFSTDLSKDQELREEKQRLQQFLSAHPEGKIWQDPARFKWYLPSFSKNFKGERRIYVIDVSKSVFGKSTTRIGYMIGVWKIDKENNWRYESKPNKFVTKTVKITHFEHLEREAEISELKALTKFKDVIINGDDATARTALVKGHSLDEIIDFQNEEIRNERIDYLEVEQKRLINLINENEEAVDDEDKRNAILQCKKVANIQLRNVEEELAWLRNFKPLTPEQLIKLGIAICKALQERLHDQELVHLDIKPHNIMVDLSNPDDPQVKFIDFETCVDFGKTFVGRVGTQPYWAPELKAGSLSTATDKKDIFSLIIVLLEVLAGVRITELGLEPFALELSKIYPYDDDGIEEENIEKIGNYFALVETYILRLKTVSHLQNHNNHNPNLDKFNLLIQYFEKALGQEPELRPSLEDIIKKLERKLMTLALTNKWGDLDKYSKDFKEPIHDQNNYKVIYNAAGTTRNKLREMRLTKDKTDCLKIRDAIHDSLNEIKESIKKDPSLIKLYLDKLNIQVLKDWHAAHSSPESITQDDILKEVDRIIKDYKYYKKLSVFAWDGDKKMEIRCKKYKNVIEKYRITLDDMAELNKENEELFKNQSIKKTIKNDPSIKFSERSLLYQDKEDEKLYTEPLYTNYGGIKTELNLISRALWKKYGMEDLIKRALKSLSTVSGTTTFNSLTELLNYQQKMDAITACEEVIKACDEYIIDHPGNEYMRTKRRAYLGLMEAMENDKHNHSKSIDDILALDRKNGKPYIYFFQKKIEKRGFFHLFKDSGDFFERIRRLHPETLINNMKEEAAGSYKKWQRASTNTTLF